ncbi:fimbria/pilus outer membrane usher protein [Herbaspirillum robiniae]|uniref:Fimbrial biogenesis outer membrane usher protein n=1 Tax=Herbaspirillum robiniae TaxID=2014887 RepID=A0A2D0B741_9BURK|nr:fimbria/pilus outer membrane usher protein [Herbaspirillum robiniae]NUU03511.1 fimbrial biogenesis outer membrane usher protein [Herbaspirillum robiniae]OWY29982.1 pilus assembly protein PapC [Herbaspirillum robiniae]
MKRLAHWILLLTLVILSAAARAAEPGDEALLLEVSINGRGTDLVAQFTRRQQTLYSTAAELRSLKLKVDGADNDLIAISSIATRIQLDEAAAKVNLDIPARFMNTTDIDANSVANNVPLSAGGRGLVLNYDLLATSSSGLHALGGLFDARWFSGSSVFSSTGLGYLGNSGGTSARLETTYTYSEPATLTRYRVGDVINGSLAWSRSVRMGGFQYASDFNLRPDLVRFPTPSLGGETVVPSTVDLFVNGVRQLSQPVPPGPFEIRQPPIASGAGQIAVAVTDELGRQTFRTVNFYATDRLLKEGLSSYSAEGGWVRRNYGLRSNNYGQFALSGTARRGMSDWLTLETHGEAMRSLKLAGAGAVFNLGNRAVLATALSGSSSDNGSGQQVSVAIERNADPISLSLSRSQSTRGYQDIGAIEGAPVSRSSTIATLGLNLGSAGSLSMAYAMTKSPILLTDGGATSISDSETVTITYFKSVGSTSNMYMTAYRDFRNSGYGATVGLIIPFGGRDVGGASVNNSNGQRTTTFQASRPTISIGDIGWQLQDTEGSYRQRLGQVNYKSRYGSFSAAASQSVNVTSERLGARGSLTMMDGSVFASDWIEDSFAVVNASGVKNVGIYTENRYAGRTDDNGQLLLTDLRAYDVNKVSVDVLDLPLTLQLDQSDQYVKPRDRSGVVINFTAKRASDVTITLKDAAGNFIPMGSSIRVRETGLSAPVGYDGISYLQELAPVNTLDVLLPSGAQCHATLTPPGRADGGMTNETVVCR